MVFTQKCEAFFKKFRIVFYICSRKRDNGMMILNNNINLNNNCNNRVLRKGRVLL